MTQISLFSGSAASSKRSARIFSRPSRPAAGISALVTAFQEWRERHNSRRDLMRLSEHQLKDIGLSRLDAEAEFAKPFWRG